MPPAPLQGPRLRIGCSAEPTGCDPCSQGLSVPWRRNLSKYTEVPNARKWHENIRTLHCTEIKVATANERHSELYYYYNMKRLAMRSEKHLQRSFCITSILIPVDIRDTEARAHSKMLVRSCANSAAQLSNPGIRDQNRSELII